MDIELIDKAWACLPREFKEEMKRLYRIAESDVDQMIAMIMLENVFGLHNLTSDAEGEEMLTVKRSDVINEFDKLHKLSYKAADLQLGLNAFRTLFGSKCLPDELNEDNFAKLKPKPAEPKNEGTHQKQYVPKNAESGTHSFNHILKDGFRNERRLNIAAMAMQGILSNADRMKGYEHVATTPPCEELTVVVARNALRYADALIKEVE